jgi:hypothetical protein
MALIAATGDETLPRIGQKQVQKLQVAQGPRWVG